MVITVFFTVVLNFMFKIASRGGWVLIECPKGFGMTTFQFLFDTSFHWPLPIQSPLLPTNDQIMKRWGGVHKCIFKQCEDCKSEHFPQLWRYMNLKKKPWWIHGIIKVFILEVIKRFQRLFDVQFSCWPWPWNITWKINIANRCSAGFRDPVCFQTTGDLRVDIVKTHW